MIKSLRSEVPSSSSHEEKRVTVERQGGQTTF
jgi:hypothetical protein